MMNDHDDEVHLHHHHVFFKSPLRHVSDIIPALYIYLFETFNLYIQDACTIII